MQITNTTNTTHIDFTTEGDYIQQDANNTDFTSSQVTLHGSGVSATGGTITYVDSNGLNPRTSPAYPGGYTVHTFRSSGTFTPSGSGNVAALVVGGGGGGGYLHSGGGGGGGVLYNGSLSISSGSYPVTVGVGGDTSLNGQNSVFSSLTAIGVFLGGCVGGDVGGGCGVCEA